MNNNYCYLNGEILPFQQTKMYVNDLGLWRGYGVFDYLRTYQSQPFKLKAHWERLEKSASLLNLSLILDYEAIIEIIEELLFLRADRKQEVGIRLILTGGYTDNGISPINASNFLITIENLSSQINLDNEKGIKVITFEHLREWAEIKTTNYLPIYLNQKRMNEAQAKDILYVKNVQISECTRSNFFLIKENTLITPQNGILLGITRQIVLDIAKDFFEKIEIRDILFNEIQEAEEIFKCSTTSEITPILQIDEIKINQGNIGKKTFELQKAFGEYVNQYNENL